MKPKDIKVLIVEDSRTVAALLQRVLKAFDIIGVATTAKEALRLDKHYRPDVVTMDIDLPDMDGLSLTKSILSSRHVPIIIVTSLVSSTEHPLAFDCLQAGAYEILAKSKYLSGDNLRENRLALLVKTAATQNVASKRPAPANQRWKRRVPKASSATTNFPPRYSRQALSATLPIQLVVIGASTGGPQAIKTILEALPATYPIPIAIAQHISHGFIESYVRWLNSQIQLDVFIADDHEVPRAHSVYFPPSGFDLSIARRGHLTLSTTDREWASPSVDRLFSSVADNLGSKAVVILLTGMGDDGAVALKSAHDAGALTIVQDEATSVIYGMPKEALKICPEHLSLPLPEIAVWLRDVVADCAAVSAHK